MSQPLPLTIDEQLIARDLRADSAEGAIRALAGRLLAAGYVRETYAEAVLARERVYPTGLPTEVPVALPHTDVQHCLKPAVAVGLLAAPVTFGQMGDPAQTVSVQTVLALSVTEPKAQVQVLTRLIDFCQNPANLRGLHSAPSAQAAAELLRHGLGMAPEGRPAEPAAASAPGGAAEVLLTIAHPAGLHARPAAKFVQTAARFQADIRLSKLASDKAPVNAKSILAVLTLGVQSGHSVRVQAEGSDAAQALQALKELVDSNFGEA